MMKKHNQIGLVAGLCVFAINMAENVIHYNIGRSKGNGESFYIKKPAAQELLIMTGTSVAAGIIVGLVVKHLQ